MPKSVLSGLFLVLVAVLANTAGGGTVKGTQSVAQVTSYAVIDYNVQYCDRQNANKYKIIAIEYRWYRSNTGRRVNARLNAGELGVHCTSGPQSYALGIKSFTACWACGNTTSSNWTKSYIWHPSWGYLGGPGVPGVGVHIGAWVESTVRNGSGTVVGRMCNQAYIAGGYC
ncbi:MAG TPA: hypothetical protein VD769_09320 [Gaiellaceae bacterium]|nr:hypothetical protein [Gaiellaceae bacterium]